MNALQRSLFDGPLPVYPTCDAAYDVCAPKSGSPPTSEAANRRVNKTADRARILALIRASGAEGLTLTELEPLLGKGKASFSGRLTELSKMGAVRFDDAIRRKGCRVYWAVPE